MTNTLRSLFALLLTVPLGNACVGDDDDSGGAQCGNGVCEAGETESSCRSDCDGTEPVCGNFICEAGENDSNCGTDCETSDLCEGNLTADDTCGGENICVNSQCVPAFGRVYRVYIGDAALMTNRANGDTWDAVGGLPDPFSTATLNGTEIGVTSTVQDTISPQWAEYTTATIPGGSTFIVSVYDEDVTLNDYMFGCQFNSLSAATLRAYVNTCNSFASDPAGTGSAVSFWFEPQ